MLAPQEAKRVVPITSDDFARQLSKLQDESDAMRGVSIIPIGQDPDRDEKIEAGWRMPYEHGKLF